MVDYIVVGITKRAVIFNYHFVRCVGGEFPLLNMKELNWGTCVVHGHTDVQKTSMRGLFFYI